MAVRVIPPNMHKNTMFEFIATSKLEAQTHSRAIEGVMKGYNDERRALKQPPHIVFHQVGVTPEGDNEPGYHAWEVWGAEQNKMEELVPTIMDRVQELKEESRQLWAGDPEYWKELTEEHDLGSHEQRHAAEIAEECAVLLELHGKPEPDREAEQGR